MQDPHSSRLVPGVFEQRALADAGLAPNNERAPMPGTRATQESVDPTSLCLPPYQHHGEPNSVACAREACCRLASELSAPCARGCPCDQF
jgi:hypothetical protein